MNWCVKIVVLAGAVVFCLAGLCPAWLISDPNYRRDLGRQWLWTPPEAIRISTSGEGFVTRTLGDSLSATAGKQRFPQINWSRLAVEWGIIAAGTLALAVMVSGRRTTAREERADSL